MQLPPAEVLLSWPTPNYVNPNHVRGPQLLVITGIFFPIAVLMVALRIFTRLRLSKCFGIDDVFLLLAIIPAGACAVLTSLAMIRWGWNRHIWDVPIDLLTLGLKLTIAMECLFGVSVSCTKISLLILTRRVMSNGTGILRHIAAGVIFIVACEGVVFSIVVICTCSPVSDYWTLSFTPQTCIDERTHLLIGGIINTFTDFCVFFLPLPTVFRLKIQRRQQFMLCLLFGAGFIVCVAGTVRIWYAWKTTSTYDRTWESYGLWIASVLELDIGIICTSIPACKPFFSRYLPALLGSTFANSKPSQISGPFALHSNGQGISSGSAQGRETFKSSEPYELQDVPAAFKSKSNARINSKQLPPLAYLNNDDAFQNHHLKRKFSSKTSISSFIGDNTSNSSVYLAGGASESEHEKVDRAESRQGFV